MLAMMARMAGSVLVNVRRGGGGSGGDGWNPANKNVLEKIGKNQDGSLTYGGKLVGEPSRETVMTVSLTSEIISQGYVELPDDYAHDEPRPAVLTYGGVIQELGVAWVLELNDAPVKDRVVWAGYPLAAGLIPNSEMTITYYKKIPQEG